MYWHSSKCLIKITSFKPHSSATNVWYYCLHFIDEEMEAQRGWMTWPRPRSFGVLEVEVQDQAVWTGPYISAHAYLCWEQRHRHSAECLLKLYFYLFIYIFWKLYLNPQTDLISTIGSIIWAYLDLIKGHLKWMPLTNGNRGRTLSWRMKL